MPPDAGTNAPAAATTSSPGPSSWRRVLRSVRAALTLLRLELKVVTGNRAIVLALIDVAWLALIATLAHFRDSPWDVESFYNRSVVVPSLVPAVALGMSAVMGDRDTKQLEVTFVSPGGRLQVWTFRFAAIVLACLAGALALAVGTWAIIDHDFQPLVTTFHAAFPIAFCAAIAFLGSVAFRSSALGAIPAVLVILVSGLVFHGAGFRWLDLFVNPFVAPENAVVPLDWIRVLFWNRAFLAAGTLGAFGGALLLLQRRERLLA